VTGLRLALDQNFPQPLLEAIAPWLPPDLELVYVTDIDPRLSRVSDRRLFIALWQLGFDGLVTNNYKMLNIDEEIAAIVKTKATVVATTGMGDDPIRPAGALLLELPDLESRIVPGRSNVFLLTYDHRQPKDGWDFLKLVAQRQRMQAPELWSVHRPTYEDAVTVWRCRRVPRPGLVKSSVEAVVAEARHHRVAVGLRSGPHEPIIARLPLSREADACRPR
jgi:hypothetical protein